MRVVVDIECPHCGTPIKELGAIRPQDEGLELGSIIVCGNCGGVSQVEIGRLVEFLDFASLSEAEQADLKFAIKAVRGNAKRFRRE